MKSIAIEEIDTALDRVKPGVPYRLTKNGRTVALIKVPRRGGDDDLRRQVREYNESGAHDDGWKDFITMDW